MGGDVLVVEVEGSHGDCDDLVVCKEGRDKEQKEGKSKRLTDHVCQVASDQRPLIFSVESKGKLGHPSTR